MLCDKTTQYSCLPHLVWIWMCVWIWMKNPLPCLFLAVSFFHCLNTAFGVCLQNFSRQLDPKSSTPLGWSPNLCYHSASQGNVAEGGGRCPGLRVGYGWRTEVYRPATAVFCTCALWAARGYHCSAVQREAVVLPLERVNLKHPGESLDKISLYLQYLMFFQNMSVCWTLTSATTDSSCD